MKKKNIERIQVFLHQKDFQKNFDKTCRTETKKKKHFCGQWLKLPKLKIIQRRNVELHGNI